MGVPGAGGRDNGGSLSAGKGSSGDGWRQCLHNNVNTLNATNCTLKMTSSTLYIFYHNKNILKHKNNKITNLEYQSKKSTTQYIKILGEK